MPLPEDLEAELKEQVRAAEVFSFDMSLFECHMFEPDTLTVVLRAQLYLEHVIIQALNEAFAVRDVVDLRRLNFPTKINLCIALGLFPEEWRECTNRVNELRNHVAHKLEYNFTEETKRHLWESIPKFLQQAVMENLKLEPGEERRLTYGHIFRGLVIFLDIARQKSQAGRIQSKFSERYLQRAIQSAHVTLERTARN